MRCPNCGAKIDATKKKTHCPKCGEPLTGARKAAARPDGKRRPMKRNPFGFPDATAMATAKRAGIGMRWYQVIIWAQLLIGVFGLATTAYFTLSGSSYNNLTINGTAITPDVFYATYPSLRTLDILVGVVCILLIIAMPFVRLELINFRRGAPIWFLTFNLFYFLISAMYTPVQLAVLGSLNMQTIQALGPSNFVLPIIGGLIPLIANIPYFKRRNFLFVN